MLGAWTYSQHLNTESSRSGKQHELTCAGKTHTSIVTAAGKALADFKNPYATAEKAVTTTGGSTADTDVGYTRVIATNSTTITISTCFTTACGTATNVQTNTVTVE